MRFRLHVNPEKAMNTPHNGWKPSASRSKLRLIMSERKPYGAVRDNVPHNLRREREKAGLTLEELASRVGKDWRTVQKHETDATRLRVAELRVYAEAIGCSVFDLVDDMPPDERDYREAREIMDRLSPADRRRFMKILRALDPESDGDADAASA